VTIPDLVRRLSQPRGGVKFLGAAAILYGVVCFLQGGFATPWQPVPESLPLRQLLGFLSAGLLVLGGAGLLIGRTLRPAAMLLLILFALYDVCYVLQIMKHQDVGRALLGLAEQSSVVIGVSALLLRIGGGGSAAAATARISFGVCSVLFALAHFIGLKLTAQGVPEWLPGGQVFWAIATGVGHVAVGLGLIANRLAVPATRLGALMYISFALFTWTLGALTHPTEWLRWAGAAISLCMAAALWLVGDLLAARKKEVSDPAVGDLKAATPASALAS